MSAVFEQVAAGVIAIDTEFVRPRMDASHLIVDGGHAAFIDAGTHRSVPNLLSALAAQDLDVDAVEYLILTHVHLDHAGGAGTLLQRLPRARLIVHPRGVRHLIDPTVLSAATIAVYGEEMFAAEYGEVAPVPAERIDASEDGLKVRVGSRQLELIDTPGHALHHLAVVDRDRAEVFAGDTLGVSYRELRNASGTEFVFPTTSPSQFDPVQLHASIERIMECRPATAYVTHYSMIRHIAARAPDLHADIDAFVRIATAAADLPDRVLRIEEQLFDHLSQRLHRHGFVGDAAQHHAMLDGDVVLNAAGLDTWLERNSR